MKGHLRQRGKSGIWYAVFPVNGKQKWHRLKATGKREAEKEMTRLLASVDGGSYVETSRMTVEQYLTEKWVPLVVEKEAAPSTLAIFQGRLVKYVIPTIGNVPLQKLTGLHLQEMFAAMMEGKFGKPLKSQTVRVLHIQLHRAFAQAVTWGLIPKNPSDGAKVKRGKAAKKRVLTGEETVQLLEHFKTTDIYIPTLIIVCTGMRRGEVLALRWQDVDLDKQRIVVEQALSRVKGKTLMREPKTDSAERVVSLPAVLVEALRQHRQSQKVRSITQDLICIGADGNPIVPNTFTAKLTRYAADAGFEDITPHSLRHGHASLLADAGVRDKVISERLGHSGEELVRKLYVHSLRGAHDEAAQKMDGYFKKQKGTQ